MNEFKLLPKVFNWQKWRDKIDSTGGYTPPYKVYTALLTQNGGDNPDTKYMGAVTKGVTYRISGYSNGDFSNVGAPSNEELTYFVAINNEIPNSYGDAGLTFNSGTPIVTVLENTIGNIYWSYDDTGVYLANLLGAFTLDKTFSLMTLFITSNRVTLNSFRVNDNIFGINVNELDLPGNAIELDGVLQIEIRVYN